MSNQKCRLCLKINPPGSRFCNYCGNDLTFSIQPDGLLPPGAILRGSYVIENVIGEGGMGVVYSCHHKTLGTRYALKVLDPKLARMDILRQRFLAEAKIQATVRHPHIVHVLDVIDSDKDGGIPGVLAIVMEYVAGEALDQKLEAGPLSEKDAVSCALVVLDAIGFAHHAGIVHRDLKPSNIMISAEEAKEALYRGVKVMDFGIAKLLQEQEQRTVTGAHMGTLRYMAPEQIENARDVDERSDLYAIGLSLYELLCGRTPFEEYREFELIKAQMSMKPPSMRTFRSDISNRLEAIVMKSLEKDRANRYPNAESFQRALLSLGGYDDIPLMLNPNDGAAIVPTNQKLQKKIERAIAKSNEAAGDSKPGKKIRNSAAKVNVTENLPKALQSARLASQSSMKAAAPSVDPVAKTEASEPRKDKSRHHKSIVQISREKKAASAPGTPSRTFKRNPSRISQLGKGANLKSTAEKPSSEDVSKNAKSVAEKPVSLAKAKPVSSENNKKTSNPNQKPISSDKNKKTSNTKSKAPSGENNRRPSPGQMQKKSAQAPALQAKSASPARKKSNLALKLLVFAIIVLIVVGYFLRSGHPDEETAPAEIIQPKDVVENDDIDDVSTLPLKIIETPTGRMTVVPAARHWVSNNKSDELHQIELKEAFAIDQVEVSYYQYEKCVDAGKCPPLGVKPDDLNLPVTNIGFGSAQIFCQFAQKTLPTREQWEAAARFGGEINGITHVNVTCENIHFGASLRGECKGKNSASPENVYARVQSGNPGHILNMLGNVREWTSTPDKHDSQKNITKGGSYLSDRSEINISVDTTNPLNSGAADLGFRCIKLL
ncbi:MAG: protein kinase [Proteobacteria bacterium]|nr:protein kinase [Pseudomonadota bacterium]